MTSLVAFAGLVDELLDWFCAVCDGPRLAYGRIVNPPKPPALLGPMEDGRGQSTRQWVPSRRNLLRIVKLLEYYHRVRGRRQSVSLAELARAVEAGREEWVLSSSLVRNCAYFHEYGRCWKRGMPRQRYLKLEVRYPWQTLADVIDVLGCGEEGGADVELVVKAFYSLCPGFNRMLPKGLSRLEDLFRAFPGTFEVSREGKVRCLAPFENPEPDIPGWWRNDVNTREDLEGIVALADADSKYPGARIGHGIPVGVLYEWGRERYSHVACWGSLSAFRRFLFAFRKSGYYVLKKDRVCYRGWPRTPGTRIDAVKTVIRVIGEADGFASCDGVADVVNRWVPGFGGVLDGRGLVGYARRLKTRPFVLEGESRIACRWYLDWGVKKHVACWYYTRYLEKRRVLGEGIALLRGDSDRDFGACKHSRAAAWMAWFVVEWTGVVRRIAGASGAGA